MESSRMKYPELDNLPKIYKDIALKGIKEEEDRWRSGNLTEGEKCILQATHIVAAKLAFDIDTEILSIFKEVKA